MKDFTPTAETISLHGLGFIQVKLGGNQRLHVWHPELPRRKCFEYSAIHNHRFSFRSRVLKGVQNNVRIDLELAKGGSHVVISHNGPRSPRGGRESYPVAECNIHARGWETYVPGDEYFVPMHEYHYTPNGGIVVTVITKVQESEIHANSIIRQGHEFDQSFDRFQLSPGQLLSYVNEALLA